MESVEHNLPCDIYRFTKQNQPTYKYILDPMPWLNILTNGQCAIVVFSTIYKETR